LSWVPILNKVYTHVNKAKIDECVASPTHLCYKSEDNPAGSNPEYIYIYCNTCGRKHVVKSDAPWEMETVPEGIDV